MGNLINPMWQAFEREGNFGTSSWQAQKGEGEGEGEKNAKEKIQPPSNFPFLLIPYPFRRLLLRLLLLQLRASLCKILISSFAHRMDFAHNFSVDFF